jgi:hypothetical protein
MGRGRYLEIFVRRRDAAVLRRSSLQAWQALVQLNFRCACLKQFRFGFFEAIGLMMSVLSFKMSIVCFTMSMNP